MVILDGQSLALEDVAAIADDDRPVGLAPAARERVEAASAVVARKAEGDEAVYGINTGFGSFAEVRIPQAALSTLQLNLLRSHAAGVGEPLSRRAVRATMALRANVLACGFSGVRTETLEALVALLNAGVHPVVPSRGSVGASGDLAPLAHIALVLIGEGEAELGAGEWRQEAGQSSPQPAGPGPAVYTGDEALRRSSLVPVTLAPKEGLALINGTQPSTAVL